MENSEDAAWVFDSLVGFLHGPIWNAPLQTFIEEKSLSILLIFYHKHILYSDVQNHLNFIKLYYINAEKIKKKNLILVFEPTENGQVSDREEYLAIHEEYKNLVRSLNDM